MILNPNCSEQVFRLHGTLEDIKKEIKNMIRCVIDEYKADGDNVDNIKEYEKLIDKITDIDELWDIQFPFTCNYETYFKPDKNGNYVDVATCNNHSWDYVDYESLNNESYYEVSGREHMRVKYYKDNMMILQEEDNEGKVIKYRLLKIGEGYKLEDLENYKYGEIIDIVVRKYKDKIVSYHRGKKVELIPIKDNKMIKELNDKLMVDLL